MKKSGLISCLRNFSNFYHMQVFMYTSSYHLCVFLSYSGMIFIKLQGFNSLQFRDCNSLKLMWIGYKSASLTVSCSCISLLPKPRLYFTVCKILCSKRHVCFWSTSDVHCILKIQNKAHSTSKRLQKIKTGQQRSWSARNWRKDNNQNNGYSISPLIWPAPLPHAIFKNQDCPPLSTGGRK